MSKIVEEFFWKFKNLQNRRKSSKFVKYFSIFNDFKEIRRKTSCLTHRVKWPLLKSFDCYRRQSKKSTNDFIWRQTTSFSLDLPITLVLNQIKLFDIIRIWVLKNSNLANPTPIYQTIDFSWPNNLTWQST